jgi:hypothetical protein
MLQIWTPPKLEKTHNDFGNEIKLEDSEEPVLRRSRRSAVATPKPVKKERPALAACGLSVTTRSRRRTQTSALLGDEVDSGVTAASVGGKRKSAVGPSRSTITHRLETTLTDKVYDTPGRTRSRGGKITHISD